MVYYHYWAIFASPILSGTIVRPSVSWIPARNEAMKLLFKSERDRDFLKAYEDTLQSFGKKAPFISRAEIVRETLRREAPRFYITYEEARRNVRRLMSGRPLPRCQNPCKQEMYRDLTNLVRRYLEHKPTASFNDALFTILAEYKAPRFYLSEQSGMLLLYKLQKGGVRS